ncbi:hypothetical protein [Roseobacter sp. OBYS 0001]|uniref:hypothetical protein n=1 Tax=Roseobacter sp. OBYS 0001 TaxID=882651 RepID=UPI001BC3B748|nr:hypothetical protein [Roseobacter sp. OBYS 0001]GIT86979.1 hypothetical protein ROBYS_19950 [Roseobacter sp. OBYS 0001]
MSDLEFSFRKACDAAGAAEEAVKIRRREGHVFGSSPDDPEAKIRAIGRGPGKGLAMPLGGAVQLAIAERLIEAGLRVEASYSIAFRFAFLGQSATLWGKPDNKAVIPQFKAESDRSPGRLFSIGCTWLIVAPGANGMPGDDCFTYFSDDPAYKIDGRTFDSLNSVALSVGEPVDGTPRILLNVSDVCRNLADNLDVPFSEFCGEAVQ